MSTTGKGVRSERNFGQALETLRRINRSALTDAKGNSVVRQLYVDPLPGEGALGKVLQPRPTLILGRRGTGKSTLIERAESELREHNKSLTAYIDVRGLYLQTELTAEQLRAAVAAYPEIAEQLLVRVEHDRAFILALLRGILKGDVNVSFGKRALHRGLREMLAAAEADSHSIDIGVATEVERRWTEKDRRVAGGKLGAKLGPLSPSVEGELTNESEWQESYKQLIVRGIDHQKYVRELAELLRRAKIPLLYVFLDDFSEIPPAAMRTLMDTVIAPMNNAADSPIRFKIAAYPGQVYLGGIDPTKIDILELDIDRLYAGSEGVTSVETAGADFIQRMVQLRIDVYCPKKESASTYFKNPSRDFWRRLFLASSGNPRVLGVLLDDAFNRDTLNGRQIQMDTVEQASEDYFRQRIWGGLKRRAQYLQLAHDEERSVDELINLTVELLERSKVAAGNASDQRPVSHFSVEEASSARLASLELNFLVSRLATLTRPSDRASMAIYAYNYGLCRQQQIPYGAKSDGVDYYLDEAFDFSNIVNYFIGEESAYVCNRKACGARFPLSFEDRLAPYDYLCMTCHKGTCVQRVVRNAGKPAARPVAVDLSKQELDILEEIRFSNRPLRPKEIGDTLDMPYQLVTRRVQQLQRQGLVVYAKRTPISISAEGLRAIPDEDMGGSLTSGSRR
jgi:hypothetical protein